MPPSSIISKSAVFTIASLAAQVHRSGLSPRRRGGDRLGERHSRSWGTPNSFDGARSMGPAQSRPHGQTRLPVPPKIGPFQAKQVLRLPLPPGSAPCTVRKSIVTGMIYIQKVHKKERWGRKHGPSVAHPLVHFSFVTPYTVALRCGNAYCHDPGFACDRRHWLVTVSVSGSMTTMLLVSSSSATRLSGSISQPT
jgi:hypothetical protein